MQTVSSSQRCPCRQPWHVGARPSYLTDETRRYAANPLRWSYERGEQVPQPCIPLIMTCWASRGARLHLPPFSLGLSQLWSDVYRTASGDCPPSSTLARLSVGGSSSRRQQVPARVRPYAYTGTREAPRASQQRI